MLEMCVIINVNAKVPIVVDAISRLLISLAVRIS